MSLFLRLALRNVFRHRIRTAVALLAIAAGGAALILAAGIVANIFRELREDAIRGRYGHLQIYRRGYSDHHLRDPQRYLLPPADAARIVEIVRADPRVARVTRRREFSGLISARDRYVPFVGVGVDPADDPHFSTHTRIVAGAPLSAAAPYGVLVGLGLAQKVDGQPGAALNLMTLTASGALNAVNGRLQGVFEGGMKEYDDWTLKVPLGGAEHLLLDDEIEQIVVLLARTEDLPAVQAQLTDSFARAQLDVETRAWHDLALFHNQVVGLFGRQLDAIRLIIAALVILGIGNAIGMSIVERRAELATCRALGLRRSAVAALLLTEAALTGLIGAVLGLLLGIAAALAISAVGITYPSPPGSTRPFVGGVDIVPGALAGAFVLSIAATLAAALLPVWRAVRQPAAAALRR